MCSGSAGHASSLDRVDANRRRAVHGVWPASLNMGSIRPMFFGLAPARPRIDLGHGCGREREDGVGAGRLAFGQELRGKDASRVSHPHQVDLWVRPLERALILGELIRLGGGVDHERPLRRTTGDSQQ